MTTEFQVLYQKLRNAGTVAAVPEGDVIAVLAIAEGADQLQAQFESSGMRIVGINAVRPVIDWTQPNFDRDEAAAFLRWKAGTLSINKGNGRIPFSKAGAGLYPRVLLERYVAEQLNEAGAALAESEAVRANRRAA